MVERYNSIPEPTKDPESLHRTTLALKEVVEVLAQQRQPSNLSAVIRREYNETLHETRTVAARHTSEITVLAAADEAIVTDITALEASVDALDTLTGSHTTTLASHTSTLSTHATTLGAHTSDITTLDSRVDSLDTLTGSHTTTLASHTSSISTQAGQISTLQSDAASLLSSFNTLNSTVTGTGGVLDDITSLTSDVTTLDSRADTIEANIETRFVTAAGPSGSVAAYSLTLTAEAETAGMMAVALSGGGSEIWFGADSIKFGEFGDDGSFVQAVEIVGGDVYFNGDLHADDSIVTAYVEDGTATKVATISGADWGINASSSGGQSATFATGSFTVKEGRVVVGVSVEILHDDYFATWHSRRYDMKVQVWVDGNLEGERIARALTRSVWNGAANINQYSFANLVAFDVLVTGLSAGSHTFELICETLRISAGTDGGTMAIGVNDPTMVLTESIR